MVLNCMQMTVTDALVTVVHVRQCILRFERCLSVFSACDVGHSMMLDTSQIRFLYFLLYFFLFLGNILNIAIKAVIQGDLLVYMNNIKTEYLSYFSIGRSFRR